MNRSPFKFSDDNKRYYTLSYYNKTVFGCKVMKAVIDCGFTCPNIDGSKGVGGCIFCDGGSGYFTNKHISVTEQIAAESMRIHQKYGKNVAIIAYFQANTNTYAPVDMLRKVYYESLKLPDICGISIGTRADCLSDEVLELLYELNKKTSLTVEIGMQTSNESTLRLINRCCTHKDFVTGYQKLKNLGIRTCLHIINGLPGETTEIMLETAREAAHLRPDAVKLQMLHVISGTKLAEMYVQGKIKIMSKEEYIDMVVQQLELLPTSTVIERITGDGDKTKLIAPIWSADKISILGGIDKRLAELNTWQGRLNNSPSTF